MIINSLPERRLITFDDVLDKVKKIVDDVKENGDKAIIDYTEKFDGIKLKEIKVSKTEIENQAKKIDENLKNAIEIIIDQLKEFHLSTVPPQMGGGKNGIEFGIIWKPINKLGIYVPGGKKLYPSTLLMAAIPALVAGVKDIYVTTPVKDEIDPAIAYISNKLGIKEIYRIGGAQAISALAYGTETVNKVEKIVGPGNIYVQAAKYIVSKDVGIDGIEGPTELVIVADDSANPEYVADDLAAQGEHGESSLLVLISLSEKIAKEVEKKLYNSSNKYYIVLANDLKEAIEYANKISPEHLSLQVKCPREALKLVKNAGAVTLGNTPPAIIDYNAGPDHILPTNGWSKFKGGLTIYDFLKPITYAVSESPNKELISAGITLAKYEGFNIHAKSISDRYE
ncbi:histidinol dehydrogenase [Acidianus sulfidivorans JP7]|uniref:Histidinol dehydrogenase n=1 Tax=Acidianus sulfidivorans JP7 TaxID=619593 RepID=A0A2U9INJ7_9CREN|nr:histidinol dehydrogenase [Acidianus sulfidivorans]AWR97585.1 histidinol dehydrogenase [Acidianus sulfidivorans JP7]